jgi:hypothetical protein
MGKSKGYVLGPRPAKDPMEEFTEDKIAVMETDDWTNKWTDRNIGMSWATGIGLGFLVIAGIFYAPWIVLTILGILSIIAILHVLLMRVLERGRNLEWQKVPKPDISCTPSTRWPTKPVFCRGVGGGQRYITALSTDSVMTRLTGNIRRLIRSISTAEGFCISVQMWREKERRIVRQDVISRGIYLFLDRMNESELESYMQAKGGLWKVRVTIIAHSPDQDRLRKVESAVRSVLSLKTGLTSGLTKVWNHELVKRIKALSMSFQPAFFALGRELCNWLVQHDDELAGELQVPATVPGQFITPVRKKHIDYRLGVTYTPETGEQGPEIGLVHNQLEQGLLVCGEGNRRGILTLLITQLLRARKRVILVSRKLSALNLCGLSDQSVGFVLGGAEPRVAHEGIGPSGAFVLNPVDAEGIDRSLYVSKLIQALEILPNNAFSGLTSAPDIDKALGQAVALGGGTVVDVKFDEEAQVSRSSESGMDAIRVLREGSSAKMFYGYQTAKMANLDELPFSVLVIPMTNENLERFAWDLVCIKLTSLPKDPNRVIILESPRNFKAMSAAFKRRSSWESSVAKSVKALGPLIISTTRPSGIGSIASELGTVLVTRLLEKQEIAVASDLLKFYTYEGMHTKARQGHRATGVLSTLDANEALLMTSDGTTTIPIRLDTEPRVPLVSEDEMKKRVEDISERHVSLSPADEHTLIELVSGGEDELVLTILKTLQRYEPMRYESLKQFIGAQGLIGDIEAALIRLLKHSMISKGHEQSGSAIFENYVITGKGRMAIRQAEEAVA